MSATFFTDMVGPFPDVVWERSFLSKAEHDLLLRFCKEDVAWESRNLTFGGRSVPVPRQLAWFGDVTYTYSGLKHQPLAMPEPLMTLKGRIEAFLQKQGIETRFNSVLLNFYRSGKDSIGMHADDEKELGKHPVIASISLGDNRTFVFEHKETKLRHKNTLTPGSLLVMKGDCQEQWVHGIPKEPGDSQRINLTFRWTGPSAS